MPTTATATDELKEAILSYVKARLTEQSTRLDGLNAFERRMIEEFDDDFHLYESDRWIRWRPSRIADPGTHGRHILNKLRVTLEELASEGQVQLMLNDHGDRIWALRPAK